MSVGMLTGHPAEEMPGSAGDLLSELSQLHKQVRQVLESIAQALWPSVSPSGAWCNDQTSKDLCLCAYRASPWIELASTHSIDEYQNSKCIIYYII